MSNFALALRNHLESLPHLGVMEHRALRICSAPEKPHNARVLARWEPASAESLGLDPSSFIDWFKQNWKTILQVVLAILGALIMFAGPQERGAFEAQEGETLQAGWFPGKEIAIAAAPSVIEHIGIPWVREMAAALPVKIDWSDEELKKFALDKLAASQERSS